MTKATSTSATATMTDPKATEPSVIEAAIEAKTKEKTKKPNPIEDAKDEAIATALSAIEKEYGAGAVMKMDENAGRHIPRYPSGSLSLDLALGGGIPEGRIIEIYGPESSGKTTLSLHAIAEVQKKGGRAAFIDAEHALDVQYAKKIGVDIDALLVSQPDCGEQALEITETLVRSGAIDIIVVDSVAALTPRAEIEGNMGDPQMGLQARLMSQALRKLTAIVAKSGTSVIFINQIRMKIGVMFGNPETTAGGQALKFYSSLRLDVRRIDKILEKIPGEEGKAAQEIVGNRTRVKVVKNKVAPPFRQAEFDILYAQGISKEGDILDLGVKYGILEKSGAYYRHGEDTIGQGKEQARIYLKDNKKLAAKLEKEIRKAADL
ncbi:MAG: recombinase RecA [Candidatus Peribacteraceae bacterium]|nr:recombinase RecA [Candidatus Peribacteraceae bacterium]|tara:strand:+ start:8699 stop:9832 length:1134 start_codon:yes stop_codon:yes gene_type:complete